jgi:Photosynthetic reaction centre cytochrome C subunit
MHSRAAGLLLCALLAAPFAASQQPAPSPQPAAPPQPTPPSPADRQATNDRIEAAILEKIKGHENEPAEKVFKNIRILKDVRAANLLDIMNYGYSHALGVTCTHCHVETDFSSDDKRPKRAAREMAIMHRSINDQLRKMENLEQKGDKRNINCGVCHRGAIDPNAKSN